MKKIIALAILLGSSISNAAPIVYIKGDGTVPMTGPLCYDTGGAANACMAEGGIDVASVSSTAFTLENTLGAFALNVGSPAGQHIRVEEFSGASPAVSYANAGGTGNRTSSITASTSLSTFGSPSILINGVLSENNFYFNGETASGKYIRFDFGVGAKKVVTEAKFYQADTTTHGTWQWQGSQNGSSWTSIGSTFTLGGAATQTIATLAANTTGYRYYQILGVSGSTSSTPWVYEFEFKLGDYLAYSSIQAFDSTGAVGANLYLNPAGPLMCGGDVTIDSGADRSIVVARASSGAGNSLTVGGAGGTGTDQNGGSTIIKSGRSTGTGTSSILFSGPVPQSTTSSTDNIENPYMSVTYNKVSPVTDSSLVVTGTERLIHSTGRYFDESNSTVIFSNSGRPMIFGVNASGTLSVFTCTGTVDCAAVTQTDLDTGVYSANYVYPFVMSDGFVTVIYKMSYGTYRAIRCTNDTCTTTGTAHDLGITVGTNNGSVQKAAVIKSKYDAAESLEIFHSDDASGTISFFQCLNPRNATPCSSVSGVTTWTGASSAFSATMLDFGGADRPFLVSGAFQTTVCTDITCASRTTTTITNPSGYNVTDGITSVMDVDGLAMIASQQNPGGGGSPPDRLFFYKCTNVTCTGLSALPMSPWIYLDPQQNHHIGSANQPNGMPSFYLAPQHNSSSQPLELWQCNSASCATYNLFTKVFSPHYGIFDGTPTRNAGIGYRANGNVILYTGNKGVNTADTYVLDFSTGSPTPTGIDFGDSSHKFANALFLGDVTDRDTFSTRLHATDYTEAGAAYADPVSANGTFYYNQSTNREKVKVNGTWLNVKTDGATRCSDNAGAAACGDSPYGAVVIDAGATTVVVTTTAVTTTSIVNVMFNSGLTAELGTCNTTIAYPTISNITNGTFTITIPAAPVTDHACFTYSIAGF